MLLQNSNVFIPARANETWMGWKKIKAPRTIVTWICQVKFSERTRAEHE